MGERYQVQLSDTARSDLDRLQADAETSPDALAKLLEVGAMLDQIAEEDAAARDRILPASSPELALHYRSEGGVYLYFRRLESSQTVVVAFFCELRVEQAGRFTPAVTTPDAAEPSPPRLLNLRLRDIPHGMEAESAIEFTGEDGSKKQMRSFVRKVDWGDSYTLFNHFALDAQPARTMITSGQKGEIEGDWRRDVIEVVELLADGTARRFAPQTVPVWTRNPFYEGTSTQDMFARMQKDALWKPRYERLKALMTKTPEPT